MDSIWLVYEETFVRMQYGKMSNDAIAKAVGKTTEEIVDKAIELGVESIKETPVKKKYNYYKYVKKGYKFDKRIVSLSDKLTEILGDNDTAVINLNEIAVMWGATYKQTKVHLLKMVKDEKFKFKLLRRDVLSFYEFALKDGIDDTHIPDIQTKPIINGEEILEDVPVVPKVKWNKRTTAIYDYIYEKIKDSKIPIRVLHTELVKNLNISLSAVKAHIDVIVNTDTHAIKVLRKSSGHFHVNHYILKKVNFTDEDKFTRWDIPLKKVRKDSGLCVQCGRQLDRDGVRCNKCNLVNNLKKREYKNRLKEKGVCSHCYKPLDRDGRYCTVCLEFHKSKSKERYDYRRANGLCVRCNTKHQGEGAYCERCNELRRVENIK